MAAVSLNGWLITLIEHIGVAMEDTSNVTLALADASAFEAFKQELKASFSVAVEETFGAVEASLIPSDADIDASFRRRYRQLSYRTRCRGASHTARRRESGRRDCDH